MIVAAIFLHLCIQAPVIDDPLLHALQIQLPIWAEFTGNGLDPVDGQETVEVERSTDLVFSVYIPSRRIELLVLRLRAKNWIIDAQWCGGPLWEGACEEWWGYPPAVWDTLHKGRGKGGFEQIKTSFQFSEAKWNGSIPRTTHDTGWEWDRGICSDGLCFFSLKGKPYLGRAMLRPDGSVAWWDAKYIRETPAERMLVHGYELARTKGHSIPYRQAQVYPGQTLATWYDPSLSPVATAQAKPVAPEPSRFLLDSVGDLHTLALGLKRQTRAKRLDGKKLEKIGDLFASRKAVSRRTGDSLGCAEVNVRTMYRYADGSESLLAEKLPFAILLRGSSIALLGIHAGDSVAAVQAKLGRALGAGGDLLYYDSTHPYSEDASDFLWEAMLVFQDGKLRSVVLVRSFDDC